MKKIDTNNNKTVVGIRPWLKFKLSYKSVVILKSHLSSLKLTLFMFKMKRMGFSEPQMR